MTDQSVEYFVYLEVNFRHRGFFYIYIYMIGNLFGWTGLGFSIWFVSVFLQMPLTSFVSAEYYMTCEGLSMN